MSASGLCDLVNHRPIPNVISILECCCCVHIAVPFAGHGYGKDRAVPAAGHGYGKDRAVPAAGHGYGKDRAVPAAGHGYGKDRVSARGME